MLPGSTQAGTGTTVAGQGSSDEAAAREAWEKYNREMAEWQMKYGGGSTSKDSTGEGYSGSSCNEVETKASGDAQPEKRAKTEE